MLWNVVHVGGPVILVCLSAYGGLSLRRQWHAVGRERVMRIVAWVSTVRWVVSVCLFAAAYVVDATCDATRRHPDMCVEMVIGLMALAAAVTVAAEFIGHRIVRRHVGDAVDGPQEPAAPVPLRIVKESDDGDDRGSLA